jgi:predicted acetyltransferase
MMQSHQTTLVLVEPSVEYRDSYIAALREHQAQGRFLDNRHIENDVGALTRDFERLVRTLRNAANPAYVRPGFVPETFLWMIELPGDELVGRSSIRHRLSDEPSLRDIGHIGYDIRPSRQGRGYGKAILGLTLDVARKLGMERVLVTCDSNNLRSKSIIEHWGGVFESAVPLAGRDYVRLRYWIDLRPPESPADRS